jgi:hypothetical protein
MNAVRRLGVYPCASDTQLANSTHTPAPLECSTIEEAIMRTLTRFWLTAAVTLMFTFGPGIARADRPVFTDLDFSIIDEALSQQCGFPVQVHFQGKTIDTFEDGTQITRGAGFTVTFTNLSTSQSFLYQVSGLQNLSLTVEGNIATETFSFSGAPFRLISPTLGVKVVQAGRIVDTAVLNISTDPPTLISFEHTEHGNFSDFALTNEVICSLLSE